MTNFVTYAVQNSSLYDVNSAFLASDSQTHIFIGCASWHNAETTDKKS